LALAKVCWVSRTHSTSGPAKALFFTGSSKRLERKERKYTMAKYEIEKTAKNVTFRSGSDLTGPEGEELLTEIGRVMCDIADETSIVFDLKTVFDMGPDFLRGLAVYAKAIKRSSGHFYVINAARSVHRSLTDMGLDSLIQCLSLEDAARILKSPSSEQTPNAAAAPKPAAKFDVGFVNPFIDGAINTLKVQCSIDAKAKKLFVKGSAPQPAVDIAGVIGITSEAFNGSIAICFPQATFLAVMGSLLGETFTTITKDVEDGAGELLNIIFGQAKVALNEKGYGISKAIPTIVSGQALQVRHLTHTPTIVVPFETSVGPFHIEIGVEGKSL
jgi:chemotaxis protein CheX